MNSFSLKNKKEMFNIVLEKLASVILFNIPFIIALESLASVIR